MLVFLDISHFLGFIFSFNSKEWPYHFELEDSFRRHICTSSLSLFSLPKDGKGDTILALNRLVKNGFRRSCNVLQKWHWTAKI